MTFEKCRIEPEKDQTIGVYEASYFKGIYPEERLNEYLRKLEEIWNKKGTNDKDLDCTKDSNGWFYTDKVPYFLEQNSKMKVEMKDENSMKNESSTNPYNLEETKDECKVSENNLIDQYDEETVLLQIPQEDTKVEDVTGKFKDHNNALDTITILKEKKKIILGQGYIRRPSRLKDKITQYDEETILQMIPEDDIKIQDFVNKFGNPNRVVDTLAILEKKGKIIAEKGFMRKVTNAMTENPDYSNKPRLNTWTCGMCGKKFQAQNPYQDRSGHAICEDCWKKVTDT